MVAGESGVQRWQRGVGDDRLEYYHVREKPHEVLPAGSIQPPQPSSCLGDGGNQGAEERDKGLCPTHLVPMLVCLDIRGC